MTIDRGFVTLSHLKTILCINISTIIKLIGYTIREAGIGLTALVRLKVGPGTEIGTLAGEFATWPGIECVYEISGDADLVAVVHVDDTVALRGLLEEMWHAAPGEISTTQTELVLEQY